MAIEFYPYQKTMKTADELIEEIKIRKRENIENDIYKEKRIKSYECKKCFYDCQLGLSAITLSKCDICGTEIVNSSTNIDKVCNKCAEKNNLCRHCGNEMD
jgi:hypothetical protein